ncbi:hypothetical protein B0T14DRAFT_565443 [Immersiella caudata]|uniref:Uncharacterized protein n=1 Tax=Immersiella caudata TaxID=314043 RepID=A0AA39WZ14_9PEZI|nr:hypothetical protein B0T14DRAFT_565443 [Immersiella caudata]
MSSEASQPLLLRTILPAATSTNRSLAQQQYLTDDLDILNTTGHITSWKGTANPVPPGVRTGYWQRLYKRANSRLFNEAECQVQTELCLPVSAIRGNREKDKAVKVRISEVNQNSRDTRKTWLLAFEYLIRDLVQVAEGHFPTKYVALEEQQKRQQALNETREHLPPEFFDFLEDETGYAIRTRSHVSSWELDSDRKWYGKGGWITTMKL